MLKSSFLAQESSTSISVIFAFVLVKDTFLIISIDDTSILSVEIEKSIFPITGKTLLKSALIFKSEDQYILFIISAKLIELKEISFDSDLFLNTELIFSIPEVKSPLVSKINPSFKISKSRFL